MARKAKKKGRERGNGEGCISQRKDGTWCAVITIGRKEDGSLKRRFFYGKTREEAAGKLTKALAELQQGTYVEPSKLTVGEWLDTWLKEYSRPHTRPTTRDNYEMVIRVHIKPAISNILLSKLTATHLQKFYNDLLAKGRKDGKGGLSSRTVRLAHTIMHASLKQALQSGLVVKNVSEATKPPRMQKQEMRVLTPEEMDRFLKAIEGDRLAAAFLLDLSTGLRRGELLALRWQDMDLRWQDGELKEGVVNVKRTLVRVNVEDGSTKTALTYQEPKTKHGRRMVPIPGEVLPELKSHKVRQAQERLKLGEAYENNNLVFCAVDGKPLDPSSFGKHFSKLVQQAGIKGATMHTLRHTYATRLLEANEHPKVVQELLGHSNITMTLDTYSHVMPELKRAAAAKLNGLFAKKKSPSVQEGN